MRFTVPAAPGDWSIVNLHARRVERRWRIRWHFRRFEGGEGVVFRLWAGSLFVIARLSRPPTEDPVEVLRKMGFGD